MKSKYHNRKLIADGMTFDSVKEYKRYKALKLRERLGEIENLSRQVKFLLIPAQRIDGELVERDCQYIADFVYVDKMTGKTVVEDVKGYKQGGAYSLFVVKRKLMLERFGIRVQEV